MDVLFFYAGRNFSIFKRQELDQRVFDPTFFRK